MDALTVSILGLGAAQLLVIFRAAQWTGEKNKELEGKASKEELEKLRTELAKEKAANAEAASSAARAAVAGAIASTVDAAVSELLEELRAEQRRELEGMRADLRRELDAARTAFDKEHKRLDRRLELFDNARESITALRAEAARLPELLGEIAQFRDTLNAWSRAGARLEWRIEAAEEAIRKKLGSHPRMFAVRDPPPMIAAPAPFDPETTQPGIGQVPAFLPPAPATGRRAPSGPLAPRAPIPREEPDDGPSSSKP